MATSNGYTSFFIPYGKEIIINSDGENVFKGENNPNIHLIADGGLSLSFSNRYSSLLDVKSSSLLNLLSSSMTVNGKSAPSAQFSLQGLQVWESTDILSFSISVKLNMVESGYKDVMLPSLHLTQMTLPGTTGDEGAKGIWGKSLIPPGPNIAKILELAGATSQALQESVSLIDIGNILSVDTKAATGTFDIRFGDYMTIYDVVITNIKPEYSEQLDEDLNPVWCKLDIDFQTVEVATKSMVAKMLSSLPSAVNDQGEVDKYLKELKQRHDE